MHCRMFLRGASACGDRAGSHHPGSSPARRVSTPARLQADPLAGLPRRVPPYEVLASGILGMAHLRLARMGGI
eukprot:68199-Hanusia_phi.AAC.1